MTRRLIIATTLIVLVTAFVTVRLLRPVAPVQFVALAFDSSEEVQRWHETLDFAEENNVRFTYFVSGPMFLSDENAQYYRGPGHPRGTIVGRGTRAGRRISGLAGACRMLPRG